MGMRSSGHLRCATSVGQPRLSFRQIITYTTELITLHWLRLSAPESSFVNEVWQLLLHEFVNHLDGLVEAFLGCARHMKVERWVLRYDEQ